VRNPWLKKNPLMSMWLSAASSAVGSARSRATAEATRHTAAVIAESRKQLVRFWTGALQGSAPRKKRKAR
jgi:hypothetical protein